MPEDEIKDTPEVKGESLEEQTYAARDAFAQQFNPQLDMPVPATAPTPYVTETYPDYVIVCLGDEHFRVAYTADADNEKISFAARDAWEPVTQEWVDKKHAESVNFVQVLDGSETKQPEGVITKSTPDGTPPVYINNYGTVTFPNTILGANGLPVKAGRRNSSKDQTYLQQAHDMLGKAGALCGPSGKSIDTDDTLVSFGEPIKAERLDDGSVKLGGYLVRYSTEADPDVTGDYFTKDTDFGTAAESFTWFNHRLPVKFGNTAVDYRERLSAKAKLTKDDAGVFAEIVLKARNAYEEKIAELGLAGKLGWSSGTASHLVDRKMSPNREAQEITRWILGLDASLTPTPAEPRNAVVPIKSLFSPEASAVAESDAASQVNTEVTPERTEKKSRKEEKQMTPEEIKALLDAYATEIKAAFSEQTKTAVDDAIKKYAAENEPEVKAGNLVNVTEDEADRAARLNAFKSGGEFLSAVRDAAIRPYDIDKRLLPLQSAAKATGMAESQPSQAGFLVPQQTAPGIVEKMYATGSLLSQFTAKDSVAGNNMTYNINDESSRANGSRYGGIAGYWLNEGGTFTSSKPKFRQLELKLKKVTALCVATDEQLADAPALDSFLMRNVPQELRFKVEDAIINGDGVGKPRGILGSPSFVSAVRTDASEIDPLDIGRMWALRWAGANDYIWLGNQSIFPQMLTLTIGQQPVFLPPGGLGGLPYATLLGRPYYDIEYAPALGTLGDLMLISPSQYQLIDKAGGVQSATSIHVYFTTEEQAYRFSYRIDGAPIWDTTLTGFDAVARSPFVGLASST